MSVNSARHDVALRFARTTVAVGFALSTSLASAAATIIINNINAAGVGFNDPTPAAPIGGVPPNTGTTIGAQRLIAFTYAANIWGATLTSSQPIVINAAMTALTCTATTATLGSAGATSAFRNFPGAPFANTLYSYALANKISGTYLGTLNAAQINANFNVNLGLNANCLPGTFWYLGLDNNHGSDIDFVTVLLHEMGHGVGFQTFTNGSTGAFNGGFPSVWDWYIRDNSSGLLWVNMTNAQRAASAIGSPNLVWTGPLVTAAAPTVLQTGVPLVQVSAPASVAGNYAAGDASFGPPLTNVGVTRQVMPAGSNATDMLACNAFSAANALAVNGRIALVDRGTCTFVIKVKNAQLAGAVGVIVADNAAGSPPSGLGGTDPTITIPSVRVTQADGNTLKATLLTRSRTASALIATLGLGGTQLAGADPNNNLKLYAPNPFVSGSSVSHYDTSATRNLLMEPAINGDLTHSLTPTLDLTFPLLQDTGW